MLGVSSALGTGCRYLGKGLDLAISSRVTWLVTGYFVTRVIADIQATAMQPKGQPGHQLKGKRGWNVPQRQLSEANNGTTRTISAHYLPSIPEAKIGWRGRMMSEDVAFLLGLYGVASFLFATGAGRVPVSRRVLSYVATQTATKWLDAIVAANCFYEAIEHTSPFSFKDVKRSQSHLLVALGIAYFGARMVDGWFMASEPVNTLPWESLISQVGRLSSWMR